MARVSASDLFLDFSPSASTQPNSTQIGNVITNLYKEVYQIAYGAGNYSADDSTDTDSLVINDAMESVLIPILTEWIDLWHLHGPDNYLKPTFKLSADEREQIQTVVYSKKMQSTPVRNVRLWNEDIDDVWVR